MNHTQNDEKKLNPTMVLRWAEIEADQEEAREKIPTANTQTYFTNHFKLQQYWETEDCASGTWQDVPVEYLPLSLRGANSDE